MSEYFREIPVFLLMMLIALLCCIYCNYSYWSCWWWCVVFSRYKRWTLIALATRKRSPTHWWHTSPQQKKLVFSHPWFPLARAPTNKQTKFGVVVSREMENPVVYKLIFENFSSNYGQRRLGLWPVVDAAPLPFRVAFDQNGEHQNQRDNKNGIEELVCSSHTLHTFFLFEI